MFSENDLHILSRDFHRSCVPDSRQQTNRTSFNNYQDQLLNHFAVHIVPFEKNCCPALNVGGFVRKIHYEGSDIRFPIISPFNLVVNVVFQALVVSVGQSQLDIVCPYEKH